MCAKLAIGLMSGTSLDGMDAALVSFDSQFKPRSLEGLSSLKFSEKLRKKIIDQCDPETSHVVKIAELNVELAHFAAKLVKKLLKSTARTPGEIEVIGFHGQTVWHQVSKRKGHINTTFQLGDGPTLSVLTGIPVVNNFRTKDIALGGHGAPLLPFAHSLLFDQDHVAIQNLGGIGNVTYISGSRVAAFDTGPANMIMDAVMQKKFAKPFDRGGKVASQGEACWPLVRKVLARKFFAEKPPKSTGREVFGEKFSQQFMVECQRKYRLSNPDIMRTALEVTVQSIVKAYENFLPMKKLQKVILCGGGAYNSFMQKRLQESLGKPVMTSSEFGWDPQSIEPIGFSLFAMNNIYGFENVLPGQTGAKRTSVLGQVSKPN
jgi:anhydro-N-acetylmuramic acid kinase